MNKVFRPHHDFTDTQYTAFPVTLVAPNLLLQIYILSLDRLSWKLQRLN